MINHSWVLIFEILKSIAWLPSDRALLDLDTISSLSSAVSEVSLRTNAARQQYETYVRKGPG